MPEEFEPKIGKNWKKEGEITFTILYNRLTEYVQ
jgi:hypothetical protein